MAIDVSFTDGTIAAKERYLLKDKLLRMCEMSAEDAFRVLKESGFGGGAAQSAGEYEKLVAADSDDIDRFIREYAPTKAEREYLLSPRDYHNAKAIIKAAYLKRELAPMLAPDGLIAAADMRAAIEGGDCSAFPEELKNAIKEALDYLSSEEEQKEGARIGIIFERALYVHLKRVCAANPTLKKLVATKADLTNIITTVRSHDAKEAKEQWVEGGTLKDKELALLFTEDYKSAFISSPYREFIDGIKSAKGAKAALTAAENYRDSYDLIYLAKNKYELQGSQSFLYYIFRRRAENANVRIIFACLLNGFKDREIKARLRGERAAL